MVLVCAGWGSRWSTSPAMLCVWTARNTLTFPCVHLMVVVALVSWCHQLNSSQFSCWFACLSPLQVLYPYNSYKVTTQKFARCWQIRIFLVFGSLLPWLVNAEDSLAQMISCAAILNQVLQIKLAFPLSERKSSVSSILWCQTYCISFSAVLFSLAVCRSLFSLAVCRSYYFHWLCAGHVLFSLDVCRSCIVISCMQVIILIGFSFHCLCASHIIQHGFPLCVQVVSRGRTSRRRSLEVVVMKTRTKLIFSVHVTVLVYQGSSTWSLTTE